MTTEELDKQIAAVPANRYDFTRAPALRPDGTVLQTPGRDNTGIAYRPDAEYPLVEDAPTREQCAHHLEHLVKLVDDFPFEKDEHLSAWLAGVLTCVGRHAIRGPCPLFAVYGGRLSGTGKTLLVQAAMHLAFGRGAPVLMLPTGENKARKMIAAILTSQEPAVFFDDAGDLHRDSLAGVLGSAEWSDRLAGSSRIITLQNRTVWWAAGHMTADYPITRRSLQIRLESNVDKPEERTVFRHRDLLGWIQSERPKLVVNALSILRGYIVADRPNQGPPMRSFESWSEFIPGAIRWLGLKDPMLAQRRLEKLSA